MLSKLINATILSLSLITAGSVFLHDTRLDKVAAVVPLTETDQTLTKLVSFGDAHTHVEKVSLHEITSEYGGGSPRIQPRNDEKKHLLQNRVMRGHHAFDNYNLPIV